MSTLARKLNDEIVGWVRTALRQSMATNTPAARLLRPGAMAALNRVVGLAVPFARRNRFEVLEIRPGYLKARIALKGNGNHFGTMYAGPMFVLAEIPGGVMPLFECSSATLPVLKQLTMTYLRPAKSNVTVEFSLPPDALGKVEAIALRDGKADFDLVGELKDEDGVVVATSRALYQLRKR